MTHHITKEQARRLKPGDVLGDDNEGRYLIVHINPEKRYLDCMDERFNRVSLGMDWIDTYYYIESLDMNSIINWFTDDNVYSSYSVQRLKQEKKLINDELKLRKNLTDYFDNLGKKLEEKYDRSSNNSNES